MTVNVPLLRKAVEWVEAEAALPESKRVWDQAKWCGTSMCVAGFVALTEGWQRTDMETWVARDGDNEEVFVVARDALGLTDDQAVELFVGTLSDPSEVVDNIRLVAEDIAGERL